MKMSEKAQLRVQIAKDVLAALETKRMLAAHAGYVSVHDPRIKALYDQVDGAEFDELSQEEYVAPQQCSVCAMGAMFVAAVDRHDALKLGKVYEQIIGKSEDRPRLSDKILGPYLKQWFTPKQLRLMECAFEGSYYGDTGEWVPANQRPSDAAQEKARRWYRQYLGATTRLPAIMQNVIDNGGTFKP